MTFNSRKEYDDAVIKNAVAFIATVFLGRAKYDRVEGVITLELARRRARELCEKHNRPMAMIYAMDQTGRTAHLENVSR